MRKTVKALVTCVTLTAFVAIVMVVRSRAVDPKPARWIAPRTSDGQPDLQGTWTNFDDALTPFERPLGEGLQPQEAAHGAPTGDEEELQKRLREVTERINGPTGAGLEHWLEAKLPSSRSSLVVEPADGRIPALTAGAATRLAYNREHATDSFAFLAASVRCLPRGVPQAIFPTYYNSGVMILQTTTSVAIVYEMVHQTRIIHLDGRPHVGPSLRFWMGDSRGRWEGDTLVVDVTNFNGETGPRGPGSTTLHVVERFQRTDANTISYQATIDDSQVFTAPWTVTFPLKRDDKYELFEYACHEGNRAVENILGVAPRTGAFVEIVHSGVRFVRRQRRIGKLPTAAVLGRPHACRRSSACSSDTPSLPSAGLRAMSDIQDHSAGPGVPAGQGVVDGNEIPYQPWAAETKKDNREKAATADPLAECFLPDVPRVTYLPFPFQIAQTANAVAFLYEWSRTTRIVYVDGRKHPDGLDFWMGAGAPK